MRFPASTISVLPRLDTSRWFGLLALPALFAALALAWISFSESLLRIAAPDPGVLPMLRMLNNLLFILLTTAFWTFWLVRQASAHRRRETRPRRRRCTSTLIKPSMVDLRGRQACPIRGQLSYRLEGMDTQHAQLDSA